MIPALRELWKGGWVEYHGQWYDVPAVTMEPHPSEPVPIYGGGHTDAALRRAARLCDGWIGNAYPWDEAAHYVGRLQQFLREEGREGEPFEIICGLYAMPSVDLYRRAEEELGITGTLCMPWALDQNVSKGNLEGLTLSAEVYRPSIEQFAVDILARAQP
jgi:alkanesulfonate monooxygenase SsuD/methylene tetrahydromethanopterin reductase-like flavin-dependent oxidoreductase (luciferase family)